MDSNDAALDSMCFAHMSNVRWRPRICDRSIPLYQDLDTGRVQQLQESGGKAALVESEKGTPRMMQLRGMCGEQLHWKTGIASPQARPGDLVLWVFGIKHCVTIRLDIASDSDQCRHTRMQIIGTAVLGEDVAGAAVNHVGRIMQLNEEGSRRYPPQNWGRRCQDISMDIRMDARTLFLLS